MARSDIGTALITGVALAALPTLSHAQSAGDAGRMNSIEGQIRALQEQLRAMRHDMSVRDSQVRAAQRDAARAREEAERIQPAPVAIPQQPPPGPGLAGVLGQPGVNIPPGQAGTPNAGQQNAAVIAGPSPKGSFKVGSVTVTLGGFIESDAILRSRNEVADLADNFNTGISYPNSQLNHESEFRFTARQSRIALLTQADVDKDQQLQAYFETDFQGAAPTANSNQTNSYNLRLRQAFAEYDNKAWGFTGLVGQAWSLLTMTRKGIIARQEDLPYTIDSQYVVGFDWARQPQIRLVKTFGEKVALGLSFENPQNVYFTGPNGLVPTTTIGGVTTPTVNVANPGGTGFAPTVNYSPEFAPEMVAKAAFDPGYGHYEIYGLLKFLRTRVSRLGDGDNKVTVGGGGGVGVRLPIWGKDKLFFRASALAGYGIGRYGSSGLPDAVVRPDGSPQPLPEVEALVGIEGTPIKPLDVYAYVGTEQIGRYNFVSGGRPYGYGNPLYSDAGCYTELSTASCTANTRGLVEGTLGFWYRFLSGSFGTAQVGVEYEYIRRSVFQAVGGSKDTDINVGFLSFRYLPFQ